jgi:hypothetical protein
MASVARINQGWDEVAVGFKNIAPINNLPDNTPLTSVILSGGQDALNAQLDRTKVNLYAAARPDIDLDKGTVGSVRTATSFVLAPG